MTKDELLEAIIREPARTVIDETRAAAVQDGAAKMVPATTWQDKANHWKRIAIERTEALRAETERADNNHQIIAALHKDRDQLKSQLAAEMAETKRLKEQLAKAPSRISLAQTAYGYQVMVDGRKIGEIPDVDLIPAAEPEPTPATTDTGPTWTATLAIAGIGAALAGFGAVKELAKENAETHTQSV